MQSKIPQVESMIGIPLEMYLANALLDGLKPTDIATRLGVTRQCVHNWIRRYGYRYDPARAYRKVAA